MKQKNNIYISSDERITLSEVLEVYVEHTKQMISDKIINEDVESYEYSLEVIERILNKLDIWKVVYTMKVNNVKMNKETISFELNIRSNDLSILIDSIEQQILVCEKIIEQDDTDENERLWCETDKQVLEEILPKLVKVYNEYFDKYIHPNK